MGMNGPLLLLKFVYFWALARVPFLYDKALLPLDWVRTRPLLLAEEEDLVVLVLLVENVVLLGNKLFKFLDNLVFRVRVGESEIWLKSQVDCTIFIFFINRLEDQFLFVERKLQLEVTKHLREDHVLVKQGQVYFLALNAFLKPGGDKLVVLEHLIDQKWICVFKEGWHEELWWIWLVFVHHYFGLKPDALDDCLVVGQGYILLQYEAQYQSLLPLLTLCHRLSPIKLTEPVCCFTRGSHQLLKLWVVIHQVAHASFSALLFTQVEIVLFDDFSVF